MMIEPIGKGSIALHLEKHELADICSDSGELDLQAAQKLVVSAFAGCGLSAKGSLELETYCGAGGALMFARILGKEQELYFFKSFEDVIALGKLVARPKPKAALTYYQGEYVMTAAGGLGRIIDEFAEKRICPVAFAGMVREYGRQVSQDVFTDVENYFSETNALEPLRRRSGRRD